VLYILLSVYADHEPHGVLEDAVVAFRKLKVGGYMIFDTEDQT